jgi:hypothetical protein
MSTDTAARCLPSTQTSSLNHTLNVGLPGRHR